MATESSVRTFPFRPLLVTAAIVITLFAAALFPGVTKGGGWFWDVANALGFAGFAALVILFITSKRPLRLNLHKNIAYAVVVLTLAHALMLLSGDPAAMSYIKIGAPSYMWAGILGLLLLVLLTYHGLPSWRRRLHARASQFAPRHRSIAMVAMLLIVWHVVGSGYYLTHPIQLGVFITIAAYAVALPFHQLMPIEPPSGYFKSLVGLILLVATAFVVIRNGLA